MKKSNIYKTIVLSMFSLSVIAAPTCDDGNKLPMWSVVKTFEDNGGEVKLAKFTSGNCYEIYGYTNKKDKVEIYYNPLNGHKIKETLK